MAHSCSIALFFFLSVSPNFLARCLQLYASCSCCGQVQYMIYLIYDILSIVPGASLLNHSISLLMLVSSSSSQTPGCPSANGPASKVRKSFSARNRIFEKRVGSVVQIMALLSINCCQNLTYWMYVSHKYILQIVAYPKT